MTLPKTMTAIAITTPGGPDALQPRAVPMPVPGPGQLLVKVAAAGVNRPDILQRRGHYPSPKGAPVLGNGYAAWCSGGRASNGISLFSLVSR